MPWSMGQALELGFVGKLDQVSKTLSAGQYPGYKGSAMAGACPLWTVHSFQAHVGTFKLGFVGKIN